jgi:hypothetical protein
VRFLLPSRYSSGQSFLGIVVYPCSGKGDNPYAAEESVSKILC